MKYPDIINLEFSETSTCLTDLIQESFYSFMTRVTLSSAQYNVSSTENTIC